ncbi:hypothetical protein NECID01_1384 [Nematocida sp. AWRm77]|nr:hypothetical protein NECID01_1384 [Nematocida sp. AWRm77]
MRKHHPGFRIESKVFNEDQVNANEHSASARSTLRNWDISKSLEYIDGPSCSPLDEKRREDARRSLGTQALFRRSYAFPDEYSLIQQPTTSGVYSQRHSVDNYGDMSAFYQRHTGPYEGYCYKELPPSYETANAFSNVQQENNSLLLTERPSSYSGENVQRRKVERRAADRLSVGLYEAYPRGINNPIPGRFEDRKEIYCDYKYSYVLDPAISKSYAVNMYFKLARICIMLPFFIGQLLGLALMIYFGCIRSASIFQLLYITFISILGILLGCETVRSVYSIKKHLKKHRDMSSEEDQKELKKNISYPFIMSVAIIGMVLGGILLGIDVPYLLYRFMTSTVPIGPKHYFGKDWSFSNLEEVPVIALSDKAFHYSMLATVSMGYTAMVLGYFHCLIFEKHGDRSKRFSFVYIALIILSFVGCVAGFIAGSWEIVDYCKNYNIYTSYTSGMMYAKNHLPYLWGLVSNLGFFLLNIVGFLVFYGVFRINPNQNYAKIAYRKKAVISYILLSIVVGSLIYLMASALMMYFSFRYQMIQKEEYGSSFGSWMQTSIIDKIGNLSTTYLLNNGKPGTVPLSSMTNYTVNGTASVTSMTNDTASVTSMTNDTVVAA